MTNAPWLALHLAVLFIAPIFATGLVNRVKAIWAGRKGPSLHQVFFDLVRLARKQPVYSRVATWFVPLGPQVVLATTIAAGLFIPIFPGYAPLSFEYDFVFVAYLLALGRVFLILGALDTGSPFEGMGASREAQYGALIEPAFFVTVGTLAAITGKTSFHELLAPSSFSVVEVVARAGGLVALFILLQFESARVPVDDPNTHLELTMIHEVMILDHSGPDLAALQAAAAGKLFLGCALVAALVNPFSLTARPELAIPASLVLIPGVAVLVGLVESLIARFRLTSMPRYALVAIVASTVSLVAMAIGRAA